MRFAAKAVGVLLLTTASAVHAQTVYPDVEYIQGREGMQDKVKGQLAIGDSTIVFSAKDGREMISLPVEQITEVTNSFQTDPGSFGRKLALGIFASRKSEYLYVNTETRDRVEVLVFKTKKNMSPEMMAKIRHNLKVPAHSAAAAGDVAPQDSSR
jgi:hypothetical protein